MSCQILYKLSQNDYIKIPHKKRNGIFEVEDWGTFYYVNGKYHREDGPAVERINGHKYWYINGKLHRLDGPALEWRSGTKYYYIEDKYCYTKEEFDKVAYLYLNGLQDYL